MREAQRAEHISRLIDGIGIIGPGSAFERFGAKFLDHHLGVTLVHRGLNVAGSPVGGTVDSVDDTGRVAAEYSIEKNYFQGTWTKPTNDTLHVLHHHPQTKDIYLLSSQQTSPADIAAAKARVGEWPGFLDRTLHFYDARRIAEVIVDELLINEAATDGLVEHLPVLDRILAEHRASLAVPEVDPRRVARVSVEETIAQRLSDANPVLAISGIAGSGKSNVAAAYVATTRSIYETPMWIEGAGISQVKDLTEARLWRGGGRLNVRGMLQSRRCLLVIDDLPASIGLGDLQPLCAPGSHILVTRRETEPGDLSLPGLTDAEAKEILDRDVTVPCPPDVLTVLMNTVGGHPFSLALINKAIRQGITWAEMAEDCDVVGDLAEGHERLADRILGRLKPILENELTVFAWADQASCDRRFLKSIVRTPGMAKIGGQGLMAADHPAITRLHDIVFACLKVQDWLSPDRAGELDASLEAHLRVLVEEESLSLRVFATTMRAKLEALAATGRATPAILIALIEVWEPDEIFVDAVGDPEGHVARLEGSAGLVSYAEIRFLLEAIEALYRRDKLQSYEYATHTLESRLPLYARLAALEGLSPKSFAEVQHHWAKALKILRKDTEAIEKFEEVLNGPAPLNSTRLQLVRLYARTDNERAGILADEILTAAGTPFTVTSSVVLGVIENLSWAKGAWLDTVFDKHSDLIEREILIAADAGLKQAYGALASIGRRWGWHDPERMARIAAGLPMPSVDAADDRTSAALGEILTKAAAAIQPPNSDLQKRALEFFASIRTPNDFQRQKHAELLLAMERFADAQVTLSEIDDIETKPFAAYRLSQSRLGQGDPSEALSLINAALDRLEPKHAHFRSAFLAHRFDVRQALSDTKAIEDLDEAIFVCEPGKYRDMLAGKRASLT